MKFFFILLVLLPTYFQSLSQKSTSIYKNVQYKFSVSYPTDWDTLTLSDKKEEWKIIFGAIMYSPSNLKTPAGAFTIKTMHIEKAFTMQETVDQNAVSFKNVYPTGKVLAKELKESANKFRYTYLLTSIEQYGANRITLDIQFFKNDLIYVLDFTCPQIIYDQLKVTFQQVIDSFSF